MSELNRESSGRADEGDQQEQMDRLADILKRLDDSTEDTTAGPGGGRSQTTPSFTIIESKTSDEDGLFTELLEELETRRSQTSAANTPSSKSLPSPQQRQEQPRTLSSKEIVQGVSSSQPSTTGHISKKVQVQSPSAEKEDKAQRVQSLEAQLDILVDGSAGVSFHGTNDINIPSNGTNVPTDVPTLPTGFGSRFTTPTLAASHQNTSSNNNNNMSSVPTAAAATTNPDAADDKFEETSKIRGPKTSDMGFTRLTVEVEPEGEAQAGPTSLVSPGSATTPHSGGGKTPKDNKPYVPTCTNVFIAGIPPGWDEPKLTSMCEQYGTVLSIKLVLNRHYAFVMFSDPKAAEAAIAALHNSSTGPGSHGLHVALAMHDEGANEEPGDRLFVRGLPPWMTRDELRAMFQKFGSITECTVLYMSDGQCKGVAFVQFTELEMAVAAKDEMSGKKVDQWNFPMEIRFAETNAVRAVRQVRNRERMIKSGGGSTPTSHTPTSRQGTPMNGSPSHANLLAAATAAGGSGGCIPPPQGMPSPLNAWPNGIPPTMLPTTPGGGVMPFVPPGLPGVPQPGVFVPGMPSLPPPGLPWQPPGPMSGQGTTQANGVGAAKLQLPGQGFAPGGLPPAGLAPPPPPFHATFPPGLSSNGAATGVHLPPGPPPGFPILQGTSMGHQQQPQNQTPTGTPNHAVNAGPPRQLPIGGAPFGMGMPGTPAPPTLMQQPGMSSNALGGSIGPQGISPQGRQPGPPMPAGMAGSPAVGHPHQQLPPTPQQTHVTAASHALWASQQQGGASPTSTPSLPNGQKNGAQAPMEPVPIPAPFPSSGDLMMHSAPLTMELTTQLVARFGGVEQIASVASNGGMLVRMKDRAVHSQIATQLTGVQFSTGHVLQVALIQV